MNRRELLVVVGGLATVGAGVVRRAAFAQPAPEPNIAAAPHAAWNARAEALKPVLQETRQAPVSLVHAQSDASQVLRYRMVVDAPASELSKRTLRKGDSFILDFGGHRTGFLAFDLQTSGREPDAPARLRLTFGEVP